MAFLSSFKKGSDRSAFLCYQGDQMVGVKSRQMSVKMRQKIAQAVFTRKMKDFAPLKIAQQFGPNKCTCRV